MPVDVAERLLWEEMAAYGVDRNVSQPMHKNVSGFDSSGVSRRPDGSTVEILIYPGREQVETEQGTPAISNLEFICSKYTDGNGKNQHYYWEVERDSPRSGTQYF